MGSWVEEYGENIENVMSERAFLDFVRSGLVLFIY
jgi:hypothetical protein